MSVASGGDAAVVLREQRVARRDLVDRGPRAASALAPAGIREGDAIALMLHGAKRAGKLLKRKLRDAYLHSARVN